MLKLSGEELDKYCEKGDEFMKEYNKKFKKLTTADFASVFMKFDKEHEMQLIKDSFYDDGFDDGIKKGEIAGKLEMAISTAKSLLKSGIDEKIISNATGLSPKEIDNLKVVQ